MSPNKGDGRLLDRPAAEFIMHHHLSRTIMVRLQRAAPAEVLQAAVLSASLRLLRRYQGWRRHGAGCVNRKLRISAQGAVQGN